MRYLRFLPLVIGLSVSISVACAQNATTSTEAAKTEFQYNDDNAKAGDRQREKDEHYNKWIKTVKMSPSSVCTVSPMQQTSFEKSGVTEICVRSIPKIASEEHSAIFVKADGSVLFAIFPIHGQVWELTQEKATKLFGMPTFEGREADVEVCSYQFSGATGSGGSEIEIYHLDCEFGNKQKLSKYRVRSSSLPKSKWVSFLEK